MTDVLPPWRAMLRGAREREGRSPWARWLQLATVATDGSPRVRTLVFRGWAGPIQLDLLTDARSAKAAELAAMPRLEIAWLLPKARCQFRLRGQLAADGPAGLEQARLQHWRALHPGARALWGWPAPGQPHQPDGPYPEELGDADPMPPHFSLLRIGLDQVELLELQGVPHRRWRWRADAGWAEEALNP